MHKNHKQKKVFLVPHNHFDPIWKVGFAQYAEIEDNVLRKMMKMMEDHPNFTYCFGQAVVVREFLRRNPKLKESFLQYVREGRLEIICGSEVIVDQNMPLGESQIRNILLGAQWFRENLGIKAVTALSADTFGMALQMPQIFVKSGFKYFISGHYAGRGVPILPMNQSPHIHYWQGPDGSRILGGWGVPVVWAFQDAEQLKAEGLERVKMMTARHDYVFCMPQSEMHPPMDYTMELTQEWNASEPEYYEFSTPVKMFSELENIHREKPFLETLTGEFNPEFSGCYTSRIKVKYLNRHFENQLLSTEAELTVLRLCQRWLPERILDEVWRKVIFNQFHDAICGCHYKAGHRDVLARYDQASEEFDAVQKKIGLLYANKAGTNRLTVFNPLPFRRSEICDCPLPERFSGGAVLQDENGCQLFTIIEDGRLKFMARDLPAMGFKTFRLRIGNSVKSKVSENPSSTVLENEYYRITFAPSQGMSSIWLKETVSELLCGIGNLLQVSDDKGDPWVENFTGRHANHCQGTMRIDALTKNELFEEVTLSGCMDSAIWWDKAEFSWRQNVRLYRDSRRIDFKTVIDWKGKGGHVQVRFPTVIEKTRAHYEVPFAVLQRGSYDHLPPSKGDWPFLRYFAIENENGGVAFVGKGNAGGHVIDGSIRVSLMRRPFFEDEARTTEQFDQCEGVQELEYTLLPYRANGIANGVLRQAASINQPPAGRVSGDGNAVLSDIDLLSISDNIAYSSLKITQDGQGAMLRLYEVENKEQQVAIDFHGKIKDVLESDMLEQEVIRKHTLNGSQRLCLKFNPGEIKTLLITGWSL